jgi:putative long chain acyl-CoA synthase
MLAAMAAEIPSSQSGQSAQSPPASPRPGRRSATDRRRRQVTWARRLRRVGLAWQNALEIARAGRLTAPYGHPYEVIHESAVYKLRRYQGERDPGVAPVKTPVLLVPPLMVASEVYDIAPEVSAVAFLIRQGVDVWLTDFGAPEREAGGMDRTLDDHVRAVSEAIERVNTETGKDVHLAGYSQGGMFCYQTAAFRRGKGIASLVTFGSPVDLHRSVPNVSDKVLRRLTASLRAAISPVLSRIEGLPGVFTSTGFKLLSARKEVQSLFDFVKKLHDRQALEKREAKRLFLGGEGFVAWPGPAFQKFVDDMIVANRMASGGFVIDGVTVTLADLRIPILYFVGDRDEMGRPPAVRGIRRAAPAAETLYEVMVKAGHFGLVVGSTAQTITWPTMVEWLRWCEHAGPLPPRAVDVRAEPEPAPATPEEEDAEAVAAVVEHDDYDSAFGELQFDLAMIQDIAGKTAEAVVDRIEHWGADLGHYLDNLRYQVPRLTRLRRLTDDTLISVGRTLAEQAETIGDRTFFLWRGRAFTYAEANRRVEAIVRGLVATGCKPGQRIGVMMRSRPSHLSVVTAVNRLGAVAVLLSPETPDVALPRALDVGEIEVLITDPESAARARGATSGKIMVLGGAGPEGAGNAASAPAADGRRPLPPGVLDLESIDPATVTLPAWYRADPGRARDLAIVFVTSGVHEAPRAARITNRRWAFSALGAAAACTLTTRDTVYCCLPLHHPAGTLVAAGSALVGGARLALASLPRGLQAIPPAGGSAALGPETFWDEVRRYGVSVVYYAGEMCRRLVDAPHTVGEKNNPVRLFAGSGMRKDVWRRVVDRFGPVAVLEFYASTEASAVLANADARKVGSVGHPLPGSPELCVAAWSADTDDFVRDSGGRLVRARIDEAGMLIARLDSQRGTADIAHIDPKRLLRDAFAPGDTWFVTGDFLEIDKDGDYWFINRHGDLIKTAAGPVPSQRIEDAIYTTPGVSMVVAVGIPAVDGKTELPMAALSLKPGAQLDLTALSDAVVTLPDYARPRRVRIVDAIPMTDGFRPLKRPVAARGFDTEPGVLAWDDDTLRYAPAG